VIDILTVYRDLGAISRPTIAYSHSPFSEVSGNQILIYPFKPNTDYPLHQ